MVDEALQELAGEVKKGAGWVTLLGVLTLMGGMFAISSPLIAGLMIGIMAGTMMLIGGVLQMVHAFQAGAFGKGLLRLLSGLLSLVCGGVLIAQPAVGLAVLTLVLAIYFLLDGLTKITASFQLKPERGWGWVLFSGAVTLALAIMIWRQWPMSGRWAIGTLVGINLFFDGMAMIATGSTVRQMAKAAQDSDQ